MALDLPGKVTNLTVNPNLNINTKTLSNLNINKKKGKSGYGSSKECAWCGK